MSDLQDTPNPDYAALTDLDVDLSVANLNTSFSTSQTHFTSAQTFFQTIHLMRVEMRVPGTDFSMEILPDQENLTKIIQGLDAPCVLIEHRSHVYDDPLIYLVFEDLSALAYHAGDPLQDSLSVRDSDNAMRFEDIANEDHDLSYIASSAGFVRKYGPLADWIKIWTPLSARHPDLQDTESPDLFFSLGEKLRDKIDPLISESDFYEGCTWGTSRPDALEEELELIASATLCAGQSINVSILSAVDDDEEASLSVIDPNDGMADLSATKEIIEKLVYLDDLAGYSLQYDDDGDPERLSSYTKCPELVINVDFRVEDFTAHEVFDARLTLLERLRTLDLVNASAEQLLNAAQKRQPLPQPTEIPAA